MGGQGGSIGKPSWESDVRPHPTRRQEVAKEREVCVRVSGVSTLKESMWQVEESGTSE